MTTCFISFTFICVSFKQTMYSISCAWLRQFWTGPSTKTYKDLNFKFNLERGSNLLEIQCRYIKIPSGLALGCGRPASCISSKEKATLWTWRKTYKFYTSFMKFDCNWGTCIKVSFNVNFITFTHNYWQSITVYFNHAILTFTSMRNNPILLYFTRAKQTLTGGN